MEIWSILLLSVGLAMDAFAVSVCKGAALKKAAWIQAFWIALCFGLFQFVMPLVGYLLGSTVSEFTDEYGHWIAAGLLVFIGLKMIIEALRPMTGEACTVRVDLKELLMLGLATSIDALAVGVGFALLNQDFLIPSVLIGVITFILSFLGVHFGRKIGGFLQTKASVFGGIALLLIAVKIVLEGLHLL